MNSLMQNLFAGTLVMVVIVGNTYPAAPARLNVEAIARASGARASMQADGVVRIGWKRDDMKVTVDGEPFPSSTGIGSWAAFKATTHGAIVMGDMALFRDEVEPAIDAAFVGSNELASIDGDLIMTGPEVQPVLHALRRSRFHIVALHNHMIGEKPPFYFVHY